MLLNWFHPALDWLCIVPLYTIQALTEDAIARWLTDQMPPLASPDWWCHSAPFGKLWQRVSRLYDSIRCPLWLNSLILISLLATKSRGVEPAIKYAELWSMSCPSSWLTPVRPLANYCLNEHEIVSNWDWTPLPECILPLVAVLPSILWFLGP